MNKKLAITSILFESIVAIISLLSGIASAGFFLMLLGDSFLGLSLCALFVFIGVYDFKSIIFEKIIKELKLLAQSK